MDKIYYKNNEYKKLYEHEKGGTYFTSSTADIVTSWLDVYPDGTVKYLWNGVLYALGKLNGNQVEA